VLAAEHPWSGAGGEAPNPVQANAETEESNRQTFSFIMEKITVLQVATAYQSVVTILDNKLRLLAGRGDVVCHAASSPDPADTRPPAVHYLAVAIPRSIRPWHDIMAIAKLSKILRKNKYDIVHTHTAKAGMVGAIAARLTGTPTVHTYHGLPFFSGQNKILYSLYKLFEINACRFRSAILSQNKMDFEALKGMKSIQCPVFFEGNGVEVSQIEKSASENSACVERMFTSGKTRIVCIARLEPVKHLETVINAIQFLNQSGLASECVIAGKGALQGDLERLISVRNLDRSVKIVYSPFIHSLIQQADIAVLSSEKEGIPRGLMEAMALKKPVVATDVVGTNELVVNGKTGFLVPFGDQHAFNASLRKLIMDKGLRESFGEAGYKRVIEHFNENKIVDLWMDIYGQILRLPITSK
jgi:glycosyltransferase involved in cell wall biosynthesis